MSCGACSLTALPRNRMVLGSVATHAVNHFKGQAICIAHAPPESTCDPTAAAVGPAAETQSASPVQYSLALPHPDADAGRRYLVFVDGTPSAMNAAQFVARLMGPADSARLVALYEHCVPTPAPMGLAAAAASVCLRGVGRGRSGGALGGSSSVWAEAAMGSC